MRTALNGTSTFNKTRCATFWRVAAIAAVMAASELPAFAAASPWEAPVNTLAASISGPIARGLSLIAIVIGGLTMAFVEHGDSKKMIAGILFGVGMAVSAANFMIWLFNM